MARKRIPRIYVVSDGRGETCTQIVKAGLVQFEGQKHRIQRHARVRTARRVRQIVQSAAKDEAVIFHSLVGDETRRVMRQSADRKLVPTVDVLGPTLSALHDVFKRKPAAVPGRFYTSERERFDRHAAIDYTLTHDDGQRPHELHQADVVLVGVSRASKSSTCFYLAYQGIKAANVPLVPGIPPLPQLLELDPERVVGLRVNVLRLITMREARAGDLGLGPESSYLDERSVAREVIEANRTMEKRHWRSFDASYLAIEEVARMVMALRNLKPAHG